MNLDKVKQQTTWNDASGSINSNFEKIRQAILSILQGGGGSANIDVDTAMSDTSENAVQNKVIKKYVDEAYEQANKYTDEEIEHIEGVLNARIDSLEGGNVYNVYYTENNELSEEQLEANKKAYAALMSEEKAAFYLVQEGNVYSRLIVSTTMKSASTEAIAVEAHVILPIGNKMMLGTTAINLYSDGHISMTVVQNNLPTEDEVNAALEQKQDVLVDGQNIKTINGQSILGEGDLVIGGDEEESSQESVYYIALPEDMEEPYLSDEQIEQNRIAFEAYIYAFENGEPLPSLIWDANPYPSYRITPYYVDSNQIDFDILVAYFPDAYSEEVEYIGGSLQWDGNVSNYVNAQVTLPTTYAFKTINGESILGEGDIEIQGGNGGGAEVRTLFVNDAGLSADELSYNAETVQLIFAQHPMIFFASAEEGTPLSEYELMGMDNGRMVFAKYELNEYSTGATYIYLAMDGSTEVGGFNKSELDGDKYDSSLDADSTNAVQNKVVTENIRALEAAMPLMAVIDLDTIIAQDTPIDNATRNALLELGGYTAGDKYFSKGWIWSRGYLYTIKVIPTDAGVQIHVLSLKGWTEIAEDNSKVNHLPSQGGGNVEVDAELSETSENAVSNKAVTMALAETEEVAAAALNELNKRFEEYATKEDLEDALADVSIEVDSAMSDTSENAVSNKVIKKYVDDADNALAERISALEQNSGGGGSSNAEVDSELSESSTNAVANKAVTEAIIEDEEVVAVALNELNERVSNAATKEELAETLATEIQNAKDVINASIIDNEEVAAAALVDLDKRLKDIVKILENAGLM